jgi:stage II sporulation protein D
MKTQPRYFAFQKIAAIAAFLLSGCAWRATLDYTPLPPDIAYPGPGVTDSLASTQQQRVIRVLFKENANRLAIACRNEVRVYRLPEKKLLERLPAGAYDITLHQGQILLAGKAILSSHIRILSDQPGVLAWNDLSFRGQLDLQAEVSGLRLVNYIYLDDYLKGVVPNEMEAGAPKEALKAQAIAARTFALCKIKERRGKDYDLEGTVNSQVYKGFGSERDTCTRAVEETHGLVMIYQNQPIPAFYHANCGGHTAAVETVWGGRQPFLQGVPCNYDRFSKHYQWKNAIRKSVLTRLCKRAYSSVGEIGGLRILSRDATQRVEKIALEGAERTVILRGSEFRMLAGPESVRSTRFEVEDRGNEWLFSGTGWGHGVGLCQDGAKGLAQQGALFSEILRHYYPGIQLGKISD